MVSVDYTEKKSTYLTKHDYTIEDVEDLFEQQLQEIIDETRWYLDNIDYMVEYRVPWGKYTKRIDGTGRITVPRKHTEEEDL